MKIDTKIMRLSWPVIQSETLISYYNLQHIDIKNVIEHHHPHVATVAPMVVVAPMAGQVVQVLVKEGTKVKKGQRIFVLEALVRNQTNFNKQIFVFILIKFLLSIVCF